MPVATLIGAETDSTRPPPFCIQRSYQPAMLLRTAPVRWTPKLVESRLEDAADTLYHLPDDRGRALHASWPAVIRDYYNDYCWDDARVPLDPPPAAAIDRMNAAIGWLNWLDYDDALILWRRAGGARWKSICWTYDVSRQTAWRRCVTALMIITSHLNTGPLRT